MNKMADVYSAPRLDGLREAIRAPLRLLDLRLRAALGDRLNSLAVVGSALTEDFQPGVSDINTVAVVDRCDLAVLNAVAAVVKSLSPQRLSPPLLMTPAYIERSRDVFGVEFLDFQLTHETILGEDPFAALRMQKAAVRLQCERELKAMLVRLRQGYIASAGHHKVVRDIVISTIKGLAPLARAMLWLKDIERPRTMNATLRKAAEDFEVDLRAALAVQRWRQEKRRLTDAEVTEAFASLQEAVDLLATRVDEFEL
jgi:hypothetical protein